jgi:glucose/arabinose dehydrogenase
MRRHLYGLFACTALSLAAVATAGCGGATQMSGAETVGPAPHLPAPKRAAAFARGLDRPRWVYVLPNGDVLVAETNAPPRPDDGTGFKG